MNDQPTHGSNGSVPAMPSTEAAKEYAKDIAPKIRRRVREDGELSGGAKFFYTALLDDSFMHMYGGNAGGKVFTTVKDLSRRYRHDKKTIEAWRNELIARQWIYYRKGFPLSEWRITAICPAPEIKGTYAEIQMMLGKADKQEEESGESPSSSFWAQNGHSLRKTEDSTQAEPEKSHSKGENLPQESGDSPLSDPVLSPPSGGESPLPEGKVSALLSHTYPFRKGKVSPSVREKPAHNKETPIGEGSSGDIGGGTPPPKATPEDELESAFKRWCAEVDDLHAWKRQPIRTALVTQRDRTPKGKVREFIKRKIAFIDELTHGPLPVSEPAPKSAPAAITMQPERREKPKVSPATLAAFKSAPEAAR